MMFACSCPWCRRAACTRQRSAWQLPSPPFRGRLPPSNTRLCAPPRSQQQWHRADAIWLCADEALISGFDELRQGVKDIELLTDPTSGELRIGCSEYAAGGTVLAVIDRLTRKAGTATRNRCHLLRA